MALLSALSEPVPATTAAPNLTAGGTATADAMGAALRLGAGLSRDTSHDSAVLKALAPDSPDLFDPDDYPRLRERMRTSLVAAVKNLRPIKNNRFTLAIEEPEVQPANYTPDDEKKARQQGLDLTEKLTGVYVLRDAVTGSEVRRTSRKTLLNVPYLTDRGNFIRSGVAYTVANQFRQRPAAYTKVTADGYPETLFNPKPGTGSALRLWMDPDSAVFYMQLDGHKVAALPVFQRLGVDEDRLRAAWGDDIYDKNVKARVSATAISYLDGLQTELAKRGQQVLAQTLEEREAEPSTADVAEQAADATVTATQVGEEG